MIWFTASALAADITVRVREHRDGDPIAGATVSAGTLTAQTDDTGRARLTLDDPGPWRISVAADGFEPAAVEHGGPTVRMWLQPAAAALEIVVEGLKPAADATRHVVDGEMAMETPGTLDDAIRLVQSLPGVTVQREYSPTSGDLSVRGSQAGDSRYYLDGIEIPYLYHFNQYASVFPASQIDQLQLYPSTFSARYGDAVGAVVEAESKLDPPDAVHGSAHLNFVMVGGDVRTPAGDGWWLSASGRRSYQDLAGEQTPQYTVWPTFRDHVLRVEHAGVHTRTGLFTVGAGDGYTRAAGELDVLDPVEASATPSLTYEEGYDVVGFRHTVQRERLAARWVAAAVHHGRHGLLSTGGSEDLTSWTFSSRGDAELRGASVLGLDAGYELNASRAALEVVPAGDAGVRVAEEAPALARGVETDDALSRARGGLYSTVHATTGDFRWMPGLRLGGDTTATEVQVEPRAAVRWQAAKQTMLKVAGGRYTQRPDTENLFDGTGDPELPTTRSTQLSAGWEQTVGGRLELGVDLYRKWLQEPLIFPLDAPARAAADGDAWGAELLTRYRLREVVFLWGWVAVQRTTVTTDAGRTLPADGDQLLSGGVVVSWDVGRFNLGARYRFASGLPYTPIEGSLYDAGRDAWIPRLGLDNGARLPDYHKVDLRAAWRTEMRGWSLEFIAEVWYVPGPSTQLYPTWNYDYTEQGWVTGPSVLPLLGARAIF